MVSKTTKTSKKKRTSSGRGRKVVRHTKKAVGHVGIDAGLIGTGFIAATGNQNGFGSPIDYAKNNSIPMGTRLTRIGQSVGKNLSQPSTYIPLVVGAVVSASPKIPIVRIIAKPVNAELKKRTKMGL